jgi:hypothetical protein
METILAECDAGCEKKRLCEGWTSVVNKEWCLERGGQEEQAKRKVERGNLNLSFLTEDVCKLRCCGVRRRKTLLQQPPIR